MVLRKAPLLGIKRNPTKEVKIVNNLTLTRNRLARASQTLGQMEGAKIDRRKAEQDAYSIMSNVDKHMLTSRQRKIISIAKDRTAYAKELLKLRRKKAK